jgi:predicted ATPase/DNA-binding CsgD family transcriptional regulator
MPCHALPWLVCTGLAAGGYGVGVEGSAAGMASVGVHGFPVLLTSFVGRDGPVCEVGGLLGECRLVTVTGPGGAGKTRLALEVARRVAGRFADGAWLAELAPAADPAQVASVVAASLGVREQRGVPAAEVLARVLARQQLLLVLDNCEHVIGAAAELCAGLLAACDDVRVLATSREPLAVAGEARYRLGSLSLPDAGDAAGAGGSEAVALFADRARRADAHFEIDRESGPLVGEIVTRLDGMPLAIELAAARVEALGVERLLDRLGDRLVLLSGGDRLAAGRHRSLTAAVEWSYRLLGEEERRVFRLLSVFPGPFTLEGAEAVADSGAGQAVLHLVDCSLLIPPRAGPDGRFRYGMLETLRAYGAGLLAETGEADGAAAVLAAFALRTAEEAAAGLQTSTGDVAAARWLDAEDATMRQVLCWAVEHDPALAERLAVTLEPWWAQRGRTASEAPLLRAAAEHAEPGSDEWCAGQLRLGWFALFAADLGAALEHLTAGIDAAGHHGRSETVVDCLTARATVLSKMDRVPEAVSDARRALVLARELGYPAGEAHALGQLSIAAVCSDELDDAVRLARQAAQVPDRPGWVARVGDGFLAEMLFEAGDLIAAGHLCADVLARCREAADLMTLPGLLVLQGILDMRANQFGDAAAHLREAIQITLRTGDWGVLIDALESVGRLCAATERPGDAVTACAAAIELGGQGGAVEPPVPARHRAESLRQARRALGPGRVRAAEERGKAMSLATAAEYALMLTAPGPHSEPAADLGRLSVREQELVSLVAQGRTNAQIADQLYISVHTVSSHLDRIRDKTGCRRRADLTRLALAAGLVQPPTGTPGRPLPGCGGLPG